MNSRSTNILIDIHCIAISTLEPILTHDKKKRTPVPISSFAKVLDYNFWDISYSVVLAPP